MRVRKEIIIYIKICPSRSIVYIYYSCEMNPNNSVPFYIEIEIR